MSSCDCAGCRYRQTVEHALEFVDIRHLRAARELDMCDLLFWEKLQQVERDRSRERNEVVSSSAIKSRCHVEELFE